MSNVNKYVFNDDHVEVLCDECFREIEREENEWNLVWDVIKCDDECENCEVNDEVN